MNASKNSVYTTQCDKLIRVSIYIFVGWPIHCQAETDMMAKPSPFTKPNKVHADNLASMNCFFDFCHLFSRIKMKTTHKAKCLLLRTRIRFGIVILLQMPQTTILFLLLLDRSLWPCWPIFVLGCFCRFQLLENVNFQKFLGELHKQAILILLSFSAYKVTQIRRNSS